MSRTAIVIQAVASSKSDLESSLPGEWAMLVFLIVMTAVLGAAVMASGAVRHHRLVVRRVELREEYRRGRSGQEERPRGRECE